MVSRVFVGILFHTRHTLSIVGFFAAAPHPMLISLDSDILALLIRQDPMFPVSPNS